MKKTIIILITILTAVYIVLSVLSIGDEYAAEKMLYKVSKLNEKITINPDVAPPRMLASVENELKQVIKKYPASNSARVAYLGLAEFYIVHKKYDNAEAVLNTVISKADKKDITLLSRAYFLRGNAYEKQGQWDKALKEYIFVRDKYYDTGLGLQVPMYIAAYYMRKGNEEDAGKAYREAAGFYEQLEKDNKGKVIGYQALALGRDAYLSVKEYEKAGGLVKYLLDGYLSPLALNQQLPYVELIYVKTLKKPEKAVEIYKSIIDKVKDGKLKEALNKRIDAIEAGKNEKVLSK